ncbi:MAG TPA: hypothetical protein VK528_00780 [Flavobacterium sp.]|nr:hypothetical protein [Flavobacterium sp.]
MNNANPISSDSDRIAKGKDLVAMLRDLFLLVILLLLLIFPGRLNSVFIQAGFEEGTIVGMKWKKGITNANIQVNEAKLTIVNLTKKLDSVTLMLEEAKKTVSDPVLIKKITQIGESSKELQSASFKTQASLRNMIEGNAALVRNAQIAVNENSSWGVVYGGDTTPKTAGYEVTTIAKKLDIPNPKIYFRQGSYRSVSVVPDRKEAEQVLRRTKKRRPDAYIVPMATWCPEPTKANGYLKCDQ